ncbi:MAG: efflux RND transporter periplasmic adaptor subunit [Candidatus Pseudobacter hemicellulosilyticus]|uniref:Efflux RND transporter periplasmic adaptor subunit n=1 Tax=Candidatus Pseudobacter hemicellulosilyticus TaxID=3121375 RepID=A0AAJ5WP30_9BACT|nr:MAG: efflux RND transporter periplasmic adaptor subunit [Pseudobacter sp.]
MQNNQAWISILVLALLAGACKPAAKEEAFRKEERIPVKLMPLEGAGPGAASIQASGLFATEEEAVLSFRNGGVINQLLVKEGDAVKKGQLLATVNVAEIDAGVQQAKLAWEKAQRDFERARQLHLDSVATLEQMQNARTAMDVARQQYNSVNVNRGYSEIRATTSGYVLKRFVNNGQVVGPGSPVFMINGAKNSDWLLNAGVSDRQWARLAIGDKATIETDALPGQVLQAYVYKKSEGVDPAAGTMQVQLKLTGKPPAAIASGIFARASIQPSIEGRGWLIPADALLDGDAGKGYVFVTRDGKTAHKQEVLIGSIQPGGILVTGGLDSVTAIIISGSPYLDEGSAIIVK